MKWLLRGFPGHPLHPPLTDATIGAYTFATAMVVLSRLGVIEHNTATAWWLALIAGLILSTLYRDNTERAAHFACRLATERKAAGHPGRVTTAVKWNVLPRSDGFFRDTAARLAGILQDGAQMVLGGADHAAPADAVAPVVANFVTATAADETDR